MQSTGCDIFYSLVINIFVSYDIHIILANVKITDIMLHAIEGIYIFPISMWFKCVTLVLKRQFKLRML
jgi:hypothetical protein